ncbi:MAG: Gfo/Idh/MocA family oxidoreductase [candidate division WOR-3 bacterium]|nr:MAG: Gfo/Idh/MocA family oxidoreductase [candidate division WOR-3 bacterium]
MKIALIGLGQWGPRLIPKLLNHACVDGIYGYDIDEARRHRISSEFPEVNVVSDYHEILQNPEITGVVIATPVTSHYLPARQALEHGKHVLVEKPLTSSVVDAANLVELAKLHDLKLMVDHITVYSGAVRKLKQLIDSQMLGEILYFDAVRSNLGMLQRDVNVVWDLAIHEFAVLDYLIGELPRAVSGVGSFHCSKQEEIAHITLHYENDIVAHVHVSWISPVKTRRLIIGAKKRMVVFDDTSMQEKIRLFDSGVDVLCGEGSAHPAISYRRGCAEVLGYDQIEPLVLMFDTFLGSIEQGHAPLTDGEAGLRLVKMLAAVDESIKRNGVKVPLS